jgi:hypothetical protein
MNTKQSNSVLLSLLGHKPVFWYDDKFDEVFCAWNGICMTQNHALMLVSEFFWNQGPTPEMRRVADQNLRILYSAGAFENSSNWSGIIDDNVNVMHAWYRKKLKSFVEKNLKSTKPQDVYKWLRLTEIFHDK